VSRGAAWSLHLSALAVGGTGLVYGWMRYFLEPADELALVNHPAQPLWQGAHVLLAPLLVFACGLVWSAHVWPRVRAAFRARRPTGLVLFALFFPLVLSGVALQVAESDWLRVGLQWVHSLGGTLWVLGYGVHLLSPRAPGPARRGAGQPGGAAAARGRIGPSSESTEASSRVV